jgi:hypothetical protein
MNYLIGAGNWNDLDIGVTYDYDNIDMAIFRPNAVTECTYSHCEANMGDTDMVEFYRHPGTGWELVRTPYRGEFCSCCGHLDIKDIDGMPLVKLFHRRGSDGYEEGYNDERMKNVTLVLACSMMKRIRDEKSRQIYLHERSTVHMAKDRLVIVVDGQKITTREKLDNLIQTLIPCLPSNEEADYFNDAWFDWDEDYVPIGESDDESDRLSEIRDFEKCTGNKIFRAYMGWIDKEQKRALQAGREVWASKVIARNIMNNLEDIKKKLWHPEGTLMRREFEHI